VNRGLEGGQEGGKRASPEYITGQKRRCQDKNESSLTPTGTRRKVAQKTKKRRRQGFLKRLVKKFFAVQGKYDHN